MLSGSRQPQAACQFVSACGLTVTLSCGVFEQQQKDFEECLGFGEI